MDEPRAECSTCREPIRTGARKCTHCDSFQDWRRFISLSASTLALLVALISVTSSLGPGIIRMINGQRSALVVSYIAPSDDGIMLLASNEGTRPAVIHRVGHASRPDFLEFEIKGAAGPLLIEPGRVLPINVALRVVDLPDGAYADFMKEPAQPIYVHATQFGGRKDTIELAIPHGDLFPQVLAGRDFLQFERSLISDYTRTHPNIVDNLDRETIDRISPAVLDKLSPGLIERLKKAYQANRPRTLMER